MIFEIPKLWAGSLESLEFVLEANDKAMARAGSSDPFELPPLWQMHDGVAVVSISGPTINGSAGWMRVFGVLGYDDIRMAMVEAMSDKNTKALLLDINSPGGHATGAEEMSSFIRASRDIKPIVSYTGSLMASAAYWMGSSANKVFATRTAEVGSIGAVISHLERSKQLENEGIKATVIRSGKWKMLANTLEPLSELAREDLQSKVDAMNDYFVEGIALNLGVSAKRVEEKMGQGRVFMGAKALEVGLIHGIATFDEAIRVAKTLGTVDKRKP